MKARRKRPGVKGAIEGVVDNPFESRSTIHKKHDVFNRKVKGEKRNVARARGQATQRREKTLLVDYERSHKANSFRDRRFGEDDANLMVEEKMWARMQRERNQCSRKKGFFSLGEDNEIGESETLTHKGRALGNELEDHDRSDEDEDLNAEVVDQLHFGGDARDRRLVPQGEKTRQELLNDIIAKSKERKLEKARGKEEQESERERLDEGIGELLGMLNQRPKGKDGKRSDQSDEYDLMMRELAYEARAQATDRLQTPEEASRVEKARLEALEKDRIKRMSSQVQEGDPDVRKAQSSLRRRKGPNDDELSDDDREESSLTTAEQGGELHDSGDSDLSDSESECDSDVIDEAIPRDIQESGVAGEGRQAGDSDTEDDRYISVAMAGNVKTVQRASEDKEIPYVLDCPSSYEDMLVLLAKYATSAEDINTIVDRIHKNHSINLDSRNKERMHNFYDVLLKRFRRVGGQVGQLSSAASNDRATQLDFLSGLIYDITSEMPEVAASLWHRFLGGLHQRMVKAMTDLSMGVPTSGYWPGAGSLVQLKLLVHLFPCTDFRHPVVTPALLHLSQCLSQCPVKTAGDLSAGVFSCGLVLHCSLGAGRVAPEALVFLSSVLALFAPGNNSVMLPPAFRNAPLSWLRSAAGSRKGGELPSFSVGMAEVITSADRQVFAAGLLATVLKLVQQVVHQLRGNMAFPEMFGPIQDVLLQIQPTVKPALPKTLEDLHMDVSQTLAIAVQKCLSKRIPLYWRAVDPPALDALVPKFQENYKMKKDGHKDAEQTKLKQLNRQVKRERKGAMRELKRDAVFLEHAKANKMEERDTNRKRRLRDNLTWLEEQQATVNQQVKLGGKLMKGGGSNSAKRARVGRGY